MKKVKENKVNKIQVKMISAFSILFIIIFVNIVLSWVLNAAGVTVEHQNEGKKEIVTIAATGIVDLFWVPMKAFTQKSDIIIFILSIGAFINIVFASQTLIGFAQSINRKLKGKELWAIPPLMIFFSICGSVEGFAEESLAFYIISISLMIVAGFDTFTGLMIVLLGAGIGVMASTVNPFLITVSVQAFIDAGFNMSTGDGLVWRLVSWLILTLSVIIFVMLYAWKVKKNKSVSITFATLKEDKKYFLQTSSEIVVMDWRKKTILAIFIFTLLIMIIYLIGWDSILGGQKFKNAGEWMNKNIPWITTFIPGFGVGGLTDVASFFIISSIIAGLISCKSEQDFLQKYLAGASDILSVCLIITTASGIGIILQKTYIQDLIISGLSNSISGLHPMLLLIILFILFLPLSFLIPSASGFATAIFPILSPILMNMPNNDVTASGTITAFSFASGLLNLFTPTSGVVMGALAISRISFSKLLKGLWPLLLMLVAISIVLLILGSLIGGTIF